MTTEKTWRHPENALATECMSNHVSKYAANGERLLSLTEILLAWFEAKPGRPLHRENKEMANAHLWIGNQMIRPVKPRGPGRPHWCHKLLLSGCDVPTGCACWRIGPIKHMLSTHYTTEGDSHLPSWGSQGLRDSKDPDKPFTVLHRHTSIKCKFSHQFVNWFCTSQLHGVIIVLRHRHDMVNFLIPQFRHSIACPWDWVSGYILWVWAIPSHYHNK